jgi:hypothetical protein
MGHKVVDIGLDLVKSYSTKVTNSIDYLGSFGAEYVSIKKNVNIYRYKERIKFAFSIVKTRGFNYNTSFLYNNSLYYC